MVQFGSNGNDENEFQPSYYGDKDCLVPLKEKLEAHQSCSTDTLYYNWYLTRYLTNQRGRGGDFNPIYVCLSHIHFVYELTWKTKKTLEKLILKKKKKKPKNPPKPS